MPDGLVGVSAVAEASPRTSLLITVDAVAGQMRSATARTEDVGRRASGARCPRCRGLAVEHPLVDLGREYGDRERRSGDLFCSCAGAAGPLGQYGDGVGEVVLQFAGGAVGRPVRHDTKAQSGLRAAVVVSNSQPLDPTVAGQSQASRSKKINVSMTSGFVPLDTGRTIGEAAEPDMKGYKMWDIGQMRLIVRALEDHVVPTPLTWFEGIALKREDLQESGSFKWRGVQAEMLHLGTKPAGIVCVSTGNTGKASALAGKRWGIETHMLCAGDPARPKLELLEKSGVVLHGGFPSFSSASEYAAQFANYRDFLFVSPGAGWPFAYGASAIVQEILVDAPETSAILAPIGGGGLASGLGLALGACGSGAPRLFGVQAANSPYVYNFFYDVPGLVQIAPTFADCIAGDLEEGAIIRDVAKELLTDVFLVSDAEIASAVRKLEGAGIAVEPGAAAAYAAACAPRYEKLLAKHKVCVIVSGGR